MWNSLHVTISLYKKIPPLLRPEMLKKKYNGIWNGIKSLMLLLRSLPPSPLHQIITAFNYQRHGCFFLQHERCGSRLRQRGRDVTLSYFWHFRGKNVQRTRCDSTSVILQRTGVVTVRTTSRWYRRDESEPRKRSPLLLLITTFFFLLLNDYFVAQANWSDQLQSVIGQKSREHVQVDSSSSSTGTGVAFLPSPAEVKRWDERSVVLHSRTMTASRSLFFFFLPCNCAQTQTRCTRHSRGANKGPNSLASQRQAELIPHYITQCHREGKTHHWRYVGEVLQVDADSPGPLPRCIGGWRCYRKLNANPSQPVHSDLPNNVCSVCEGGIYMQLSPGSENGSHLAKQGYGVIWHHFFPS